MRIGSGLAVPAAGVAVFALGRTFGELPADKHFWAGVVAMLGAAALLHPGAFFRLDAPRWWFSGSRPAPSSAYLWSSRISGAVLLAASILFVLLAG